MSPAAHPVTDSRKLAMAGFSVLEAIIALVVASMILSVILPIASRSVSDNLRVGMRGLDAVALSIEESAFRGLAAAAVPAPTLPFRPAPREMLTGTPSEIVMTAMTPQVTLCVPQGEPVPVTLSIEQSGEAGRLVCRAAERERELLRWQDGTASFAFSLDGGAWSDVWPTGPDTSADVAQFGVSQRTSIKAPRVRFTLMRAGRPAISWIAPFGYLRPIEYRLDDMSPSADQAPPP